MAVDPPDAPSTELTDASNGRRGTDATSRRGPVPGTVGPEALTEAELEAAREARRRSAAAKATATKSSTRNLVEWAAVIVGAVLIAVVVRTFIFQTFWIPSESMSTTLVTDDRVLVNKLSYRLHDVRRGDVVVFERPPDMPPSDIKDLIKRVVGLSGESIRLSQGKVYVDGRVLEEPYTNGQPTEPCADGDPALASEAGLEIPEGQVLVMGDNRGNSEDGRCFGPIDEDLIVGRAFLVMWPPSKIGGL